MTTSNALTPSVCLLTFPPMIDSEACRFLLAHYGVSYREEAHLFGWASVLSLWHGWTPQIPLLYGKQYQLAGPRQIADHFEKRCQPTQKLIPADKHISDEVALDWDRLNGTFGTAVAVFAYYQLLPHRDIVLEPFSRGMPAGEQSFLKKAYPSFAGLFRLLLQLNARHANESLAIIRSTIDDIDRRLKDDRMYLVGGRFTLADIALASSAAPILLPQGFTAQLPSLEQMPPEMASLIGELRQHETGRFVARIYHEHRNSRATLG
jgi:glutathione S-transferase